MSVKNQAERRLLKERRAREALEQELAKFREYCSAQEREIEALQGLLRKHGIEFQSTERPVMGSTINVVAEVNEPREKSMPLGSDYSKMVSPTEKPPIEDLPVEEEKESTEA